MVYARAHAGKEIVARFFAGRDHLRHRRINDRVDRDAVMSV